MSVYAIFANGKESWKMIQDPRKSRDPLQNLIDFSLVAYIGHDDNIKIRSKVFEIFCRHTDRQTDRQTATNT